MFAFKILEFASVILAEDLFSKLEKKLVDIMPLGCLLVMGLLFGLNVDTELGGEEFVVDTAAKTCVSSDNGDVLLVHKWKSQCHKGLLAGVVSGLSCVVVSELWVVGVLGVVGASVFSMLCPGGDSMCVAAGIVSSSVFSRDVVCFSYIPYYSYFPSNRILACPHV